MESNFTQDSNSDDDSEINIQEDISNDKVLPSSPDDAFFKKILLNMSKAQQEAKEGINMLDDEVGAYIDSVKWKTTDYAVTECDLIKVSHFKICFLVRYRVFHLNCDIFNF